MHGGVRCAHPNTKPNKVGGHAPRSSGPQRGADRMRPPPRCGGQRGTSLKRGRRAISTRIAGASSTSMRLRRPGVAPFLQLGCLQRKYPPDENRPQSVPALTLALPLHPFPQSLENLLLPVASFCITPSQIICRLLDKPFKISPPFYDVSYHQSIIDQPIAVNQTVSKIKEWFQLSKEFGGNQPVFTGFDRGIHTARHGNPSAFGEDVLDRIRDGFGQFDQ